MIDFCVAINGVNLKYFVPLFFHTLFTKVDVSQLHIHVVEKGIEDEVHQYIEQRGEESPVPFTIYTLKHPFVEEIGPARSQVSWTAGDTGSTCSWMMENCGDNEWVIISHFDMAFNGDFVNELISKMTSDIGIIGQHDQGLVAISRIAFNQCAVGFQDMSGYFAVLEGHDYKLRSGGDPRCTERSIRIEGCDVMELLVLDMQFRHWNIDPFLGNCWTHVRAGSGYHNNPKTEEGQRNKVLKLMEKEGVSPIGGN